MPVSSSSLIEVGGGLPNMLREGLVTERIHIYDFYRAIFIRLCSEDVEQAAFPGYTITYRFEVQGRYEPYSTSGGSRSYLAVDNNILRASCIGSAGFDLMEGTKLHMVAYLHLRPLWRLPSLRHIYTQPTAAAPGHTYSLLSSHTGSRPGHARLHSFPP